MAYSIGVQDFLARFTGGGARPNLYMVRMAFPAGVEQGDSTEKSYLCKAASLPETSIGVAIAPFMGREVKVAGDKTYADWTITMMTDTNFNARASFEKWMDLMNGHKSNLGSEAPLSYFANMGVDVLGRNGEILYTVELEGTFPQSIGEIALGYDTNNTIMEFPVTFAVNSMTTPVTT